jgi:hypothetical protein
VRSLGSVCFSDRVSGDATSESGASSEKPATSASKLAALRYIGLFLRITIMQKNLTF